MTPLALVGALLLQQGGVPAWSEVAGIHPTGGQTGTAVSDRGRAAAGDQRLRELDRLMRDGHFPAAQALARATLSELDREGEGNSAIVAQVIDHLLVATWRSGDVGSGEALALARRLVAQQEARFGRASPEAAASLIALGRTHVLRDEKQEADRVLLEALELSRKALGPRHPQVAECQYWLGLSDLASGRYAPAQAWFEQALEIREQAFGIDSVPAALAMARIGDCVARSGNFKDAIPMLRRAVDIIRRQVAPDHPDQFLVLMTLAMHLRNDGEYTESASYIEQVVQVSERRFGPDSPLTAVYVGLLGDTYAAMGRYAQAQRLYERSLDALLKSAEPDVALVVATQGSIGMLLVEMHLHERAIEQLRAAAQGYLGLQGEWSAELANIFSAEADALAALGRYQEAEARLVRARQIFEKNFGPDSPNIAEPLNRLAQLRIEQGDPVAAKALAEQAMRILAKAPEHNRASFDDAIAVLAAAHRDLGNYAEAMDLSERRLQGAQEVYGSASPRVADALIEHAALLAEVGLRSAATQDAIAGEGISRDNLALIARSSAEPEAVAYAAHRESAVDLLVTMAGEARDQDGLIAAAAGDSVVRARALVLDEIAARRRGALAADDVEITHLLDDMQKASDRLSNLIVRGPREGDRPGYPDALEAARREKQRAERALAARSADFQRTLTWSSIGLQAVRAALPPHAALVSFVRYNLLDIAPRQAGGTTPRRVSVPSYAALVIPPDGGQPSFLRLASAASIDEAVTALRENVLNEALAGSSRSDEPGYRAQAARLRQAIWDPLLPQLAGASLVFVVPDGALNLVNLAALPEGSTEYLVEHEPALHYLSAERDLATDGIVAGMKGGLLAVSDADFEGQRVLAAVERHVSPVTVSNGPAWGQAFRGQRSACGSFRTMRFKPLPGSGREAREIAGIWERGAASMPQGIDDRQDGSHIVMLTGPAARESAFKRDAHGHQVLHLATHGFFLGGQCGSILDSSTPATDASAAASVTRENPLLLSGLAFAGANRRESAGPDEDDGILTAEEVAALDLQGTEWAVLSACDTGIGEIRSGEGVFGLRRAFQIAGARTVIISLWPVDDESSRNWMTRLYQRRFVEGSSTAAAVSGTTLEVLQQRRRRGESTHPFYWAGFIAAGDWR